MSKLLLLGAVLSCSIFASLADHSHRVSVDALQLALQLDTLEEEGAPTPAALQERVDAVAREVSKSLFEETLPLSARLTALAALTRLGPGATVPPLAAQDLPSLRNPELQSMARVSLDVILSRRQARAQRVRR